MDNTGELADGSHSEVPEVGGGEAVSSIPASDVSNNDCSSARLSLHRGDPLERAGVLGGGLLRQAVQHRAVEDFTDCGGDVLAGSLLLSSGLGSDLGLGLWAVRNIRPLVWGEVGEIKILERRFYGRRKTFELRPRSVRARVGLRSGRSIVGLVNEVVLETAANKFSRSQTV